MIQEYLLMRFECAESLRRVPAVTSYLGYCMARERGQIRKALHLCSQAAKVDPGNPVHFLNLGRVYLLADQKKKAIKAFAIGLKRGGHPRISAELRKLGRRKSVPIKRLPRNHPLNRALGRFMSCLGMR